jgi:hypothetical protein
MILFIRSDLKKEMLCVLLHTLVIALRDFYEEERHLAKDAALHLWLSIF